MKRIFHSITFFCLIISIIYMNPSDINNKEYKYEIKKKQMLINQDKANVLAKREFGRYYDTKVVKEKCGECGDPDGLVYVEGCLMCQSCGHSKCG